MRRATIFALLAAGCAGIAPTNTDTTPTNDLPNPYRSVSPWGQTPDGRAWGALNAVWVDNDGHSLWVADRCGANPDVPPGASPVAYDSCAGSKLAPVMKFDAAGKSLVTAYEPENAQIFVDEERLATLHLSLRDLAAFLETQPYVFAVFTEDEIRNASRTLKRR